MDQELTTMAEARAAAERWLDLLETDGKYMVAFWSATEERLDLRGIVTFAFPIKHFQDAPKLLRRHFAAQGHGGNNAPLPFARGIGHPQLYDTSAVNDPPNDETIESMEFDNAPED